MRIWDVQFEAIWPIRQGRVIVAAETEEIALHQAKNYPGTPLDFEDCFERVVELPTPGVLHCFTGDY